MTSLAAELSDITGQVFSAAGLPAEFGRVRASDRPDLAQFQCNGAMAAAKAARKNPREVAQEIVTALSANPAFTKIEIAGPGFINLDVTDAFLQQYLEQAGRDPRLGVPKASAGKIILDYGGMNVAKSMHVGHLRPNVIGACLKNILGHAGYDALGDIHLGDWGLQMGQIISAFEILHPEWVYFDRAFTGPYPAEAPFSYHGLEEIYPLASAACKDDPARLEQARRATAELQEGRPGYRALWQHFIRLSIADIKDNLAPLEIDFDIWKGEADVAHLIPEIAQDLEKRKISQKSEGAVIIPVVEESDNKEIPPLMFFKSDGAVTYGTTDIATIYERMKLYPGLAKMIYVVDKRQSLHFEQVFRAARKAGYANNVDLIHIGNGTVNGPDGKPFKTREGKAMTFRGLVTQAIEKAAARLEEAALGQDLGEAERKDIAVKVARAALKYAELSNQPHMDYIFDLDRMVNFEGKTGPYILYQAVRIKSLLRKAGEQKIAASGALAIHDPDRPLALLLAQMPDAFEAALQNYAPHHLCDYAYRLAQQFSSFYAACHILSETDEKLRASRLALCDLTRRQLEAVLGLLGIDVPERM